VQGLPIVSGGQIIKYLTKSRHFIISRKKGSHVILKSADSKRTVTVPLHNQLDRGTLSAILASAGIETDEFIEEWKR
jgi:predicted RNA binding protein YcfA (HicA-like mRNA interferase family)